MNRTAVIGLDSIDWEILHTAIQKRRVSSLERIFSEGVSGSLRTVDPPLSVPAWLCFSTGKKPDKLDVYDFDALEPGTYDLNNVRNFHEFQEDVFWTNIENVGVIGVPSIFPLENCSIDGFIVSGPFGPHKAYPEDFSNEVEDFGYNAVVPNLWKYDEGLEHLEMEGDFMSQVLEERSPEFFIGVTSVTDRLQHSYCNDEEKMVELYSKADEFVGKIMQHFDEEDNVFIVSDHGSSEIKKVFYINTWLEDQGLLSFNKGGSKKSRLKEQLRYKTKNIAKDVLSRLNLLDFALDNVPESIQSEVRNKSDVWDKIDWSSTKAFATGGYVGQIYINTEEYPEGPVPEGEYDEVRDDIIERLKALEDPETGEKVVDQVWRKEEIYREELADRAPDIMFYPKDMAYKVNDGFHGKVFDESIPNGSHGLNGVVLGRGPDIKQGAEIDLHLTDMAPTLLHLMGEEVPEDMDGEVRKEIFREGSEPKNREVEYTSKELEGLDF